jgi:ER lumen protein retaining receptor
MYAKIATHLAPLIAYLRPRFVQITWCFSIYVEALSILPQLFLLQRHSEVENLTGHYVFMLGTYR